MFGFHDTGSVRPYGTMAFLPGFLKHFPIDQDPIGTEDRWRCVPGDRRQTMTGSLGHLAYRAIAIYAYYSCSMAPGIARSIADAREGDQGL